MDCCAMEKRITIIMTTSTKEDNYYIFNCHINYIHLWNTILVKQHFKAPYTCCQIIGEELFSSSPIPLFSMMNNVNLITACI